MHKTETTKEIKVPLYTDSEAPKDRDNYCLGGAEPKTDTLGAALERYADDAHVSQSDLSRLTGLSMSAINRFYSNESVPGYRSIVYLCVALRLHYSRVEYLYSFTTHILRKSDPYFYTLMDFLVGCPYHEQYTVKALRKKLAEERAERKRVSALANEDKQS